VHKVQIVLDLKPDDWPHRQNLPMDVMDLESRFLPSLVRWGQVSAVWESQRTQRTHIDSENPHSRRVLARGTPKVNVSCSLMKDRIHSSINGSRALCWTVAASFQFRNPIQLTGLLGREISPSQGRYLHRGQQKTGNKRTQTSMPRVGFKRTTQVYEWAKTVHAVERATTVIGEGQDYWNHYCCRDRNR
jgi:hypothetical protein